MSADYQKYMTVIGRKSAVPTSDYTFVFCPCGSSHWIAVVQNGPGYPDYNVGLPPVIALICKHCMHTLDQTIGPGML